MCAFENIDNADKLINLTMNSIKFCLKNSKIEFFILYIFNKLDAKIQYLHHILNFIAYKQHLKVL